LARRSFELSSDHAFWLVVIVLFGATVFFVSNVQQRRGQLRTDRSVEIESGAVVEVVRIIDANTISVRDTEGETFLVRLLGVKGFSTTINEPGISGLGQAAVAALQEVMADKEIHVVFDELATDRSGQVLAYLEAEEHDVGEQMIERGHLVTFTRHAFSRELAYLSVEAEARTKKTGLWGNYKAVSRVQGWQDTWKIAREAEG